MHETSPPNAQSPDPPPPRRLTRSGSDRLIGGVAGGLGRYFGTDPILFRVGFVVLLLAGGSGALAYLALWVVVPSDGTEPPADQRSSALAVLGAIALAIAALSAIGPLFAWDPFFFGQGLIAVVVVGAIGFFLWRAARAGEGDPQVSEVARRVALIAGATLLALAGGCAAAVASAAGGGTAVAVLVIALGVAMLVRAFAGGGRWLILPAFVLALPLAFVRAADLDVTGGVGDRRYTVASAADLRPRYELGAGELVIDLRDVRFPRGRTDLNVRMGMGHVVVRVPSNVCITSRVRLGAGWASVLDRESGGLDVDWHQAPPPGARTPELHIDADIGMGALEVRDWSYAVDDFGRGFGRRHRSFDGTTLDDACRGTARRAA